MPIKFWKTEPEPEWPKHSIFCECRRCLKDELKAIKAIKPRRRSKTNG